jgi:hypothetical protein
MEEVLSATGLNNAEASYTFDEYLLYKKANAKQSTNKVIYKYLSEATLNMKYLNGAIDESGSVVFNIVINISY